MLESCMCNYGAPFIMQRLLVSSVRTVRWFGNVKSGVCISSIRILPRPGGGDLRISSGEAGACKNPLCVLPVVLLRCDDIFLCLRGRK